MIYTLTFHYAKNYGAFLQAFALNKALPDGAKIFNYKPNYSWMVGARAKKIPLLWRILGYYRFIKGESSRIPFPEFSMLPCSQEINDLKKAIKSFREGDVLISGSDQVWNSQFVADHADIYFQNTNQKVKKIAYAASIGVDKWPEPFEKYAMKRLKSFSAISVREENAEAYLRSLGIENVCSVCDPTLLHDAFFYRENFPYDQNKKLETFSFVYRIREKITPDIRSILLENNIEVNLSVKESVVSVTEWLRLIDQAEFIVTDSFHCVVFSLLFHKPFVVILNTSTKQGMNKRFSSLLGRMGLLYRCVNGNDGIEIKRIMSQEICWNKVDEVLAEWKNRSLTWLQKAVNS